MAVMATGLTAQQQNAVALVALIRRRLGDALIATADDPCLEGWLAFMGSCASLPRAHPDPPSQNLLPARHFRQSPPPRGAPKVISS